MNRDEQKLRDAFERKLDDLKPSTSVEAIRRGARRGRMMTAFATVAFMSVAGIGTYALTRTTGDDQDRVVGPGPEADGGLIAFTTQGPDDPMPWIATVPVAGGDVTKLHEGSDPSWSSDGTRIAFACHPGICTMNADGSDVDRISNPPGGAIDEDPDWGFDHRILFTRSYLEEPGRDPDIFVTPFPNKTEQRIGHADPADSQPSWSPDGRHIALIRGVGWGLEAPSEGFQLFVANDDGGEARQLTTDGASRPDWSPDGRTILFDQASALWTIPIEGGDPTKLPVVSGQSFDVGSFPGWAPDSHRFAFMCSSSGDDNNDICVGDIDSEGYEVLVATGENEASPAWQPTIPVSDEEPEVATFGRYTFSIGGGFDGQRGPLENVGIVEVNSEGGTVCVESHILGATAAHLHRTDETHSAITIFEPPTDYQSTLCARDLDRTVLQEVIEDPSAYFIEFHKEGSDGTLTAPLEIMGKSDDHRPDCPPIDIASDEYGLQTWQRLADPGTRIFVGGTTLRGEDGQWAPSDRLELWWNTDTPGGEPIADGPAMKLATVTDMDGCFFDTDFQVPNANPGRYQVSAFIFDSSGYGQFGPFRFEVPEPRFGGGGTEYAIGRARITNYTDGGYLIMFDADWLADGEAQPETCHYQVQDGSGRLIAEGDFRLNQEGHNIEQPFDVSPGEEPRWLELFCAGEMF